MPSRPEFPRRKTQYGTLVFTAYCTSVESIRPSPAHGRSDRLRTRIGYNPELSAMSVALRDFEK